MSVAYFYTRKYRVACISPLRDDGVDERQRLANAGRIEFLRRSNHAAPAAGVTRDRRLPLAYRHSSLRRVIGHYPLVIDGLDV
jgi:hypothetical protein